MKPILLCSIVVLSGPAFLSQDTVAQTADVAEVTADDAEVTSDDAEVTTDDAEVTTDDAEVAADDAMDTADGAEAITKSGFSREDTVLASLSIFVLAVFVGFEVITKVPPTLHTPLMSGSNAISGITVVGALLAAGIGVMNVASVTGMLAVILATINVVGGFLVTHRMLSMFRRK